MFILRTN